MHNTLKHLSSLHPGSTKCCAHWEKQGRYLIMMVLSIVLLHVLAGCGGGGGNGGTSSAPHIAATLICFPAGSTPTGFDTNCWVNVLDGSSTGSPITNASVVMNGVALRYNATTHSYEGTVYVAPGANVALNVTVGSVVCSSFTSQFASYPTISAPIAGANWASSMANTVSWSGGTQVADSAVALGIIDATNPEGRLIWPSNNSFIALPASSSFYYIPANSLSPGNGLVAVGSAKAVAIQGATPDSALVIGGFNYVPITMSNLPTASLASIAVTPNRSTVVPGKTLQLTATGTYSDGSSVDLTAQVSWSSSDNSTAIVSPTGLVSGVASGAVTVTASSTGISGSTSVNVFKPTPSQSLPLSQSVAYQIDYAHSGYSYFSSGVTFPGSPSWSATLNGAISYPLIADGKVFVTTSRVDSSGGYGTSLYALDERTGAAVWGPIAISGTYFWSGHAFDHGKIFVINFDGLLRSFDAATGQPGWSIKLPGQYAFSAPPTAVNGIVYLGGAGSGGTLYAVDESNGTVIWTSGVMNGDMSSPTVSTDGVFVSYPCQVYKFDPLTGSSLWHYSGACEGGGGKTSVYANGLLYVRDSSDEIFNAATGSMTGSFNAGPAPAFSAQYGFFQSSGTLTGIDLSTRQVLWSFAGDGNLVSAPVVINQSVIVGSGSGNVYAVNAATGALMWTGKAAAGISRPDEQNVSQPLTGFGAGEGYLIVPAGNTLTAWYLAGP